MEIKFLLECVTMTRKEDQIRLKVISIHKRLDQDWKLLRSLVETVFQCQPAKVDQPLIQQELVAVMAQLDFVPDAVYTPFGTGGTFTSLMLTLRDKGFECPMIGISVNRDLERCEQNLDKWWNALSLLLERDPKSSRGSYEIYDEFIGKEYGDPTPACLDAILLMARTEGILLDPVYSGKVMSGLLAHVKEGRWRSGQKILFLHTGGIPALFNYHAVLAEHLKNRPDHMEKF